MAHKNKIKSKKIIKKPQGRIQTSALQQQAGQKEKSPVKKIWTLLWKENSVLSWLICIFLAFIIVKFIIYPLLSISFGTEFPVVAVVSNSMKHDADFDSWWKSQESVYTKLGISKEEFTGYAFASGFSKGDLMFIKKEDNLRIGDIIVFMSEEGKPIIHRIVSIKEDGNSNPGKKIYQTKGDRNSASRYDELEITEDRIIGKAAYRIPGLGWIKIILMDIVNEIKK